MYLQIPIEQVKAYLEQLRKQQQQDEDVSPKGSLLKALKQTTSPTRTDVKLHTTGSYESLRSDAGNESPYV